MNPLDIITAPERIVCFMDILGFKEIVQDFQAGDTKLFFALRATLKETMSLFSKENNTYNQNEVFTNFKKQLDYKTFSDCICVSIPTYVEGLHFLEILKGFLGVVSAFQTAMLEMGDKGYLIRGGISVSSYYHDENMIFSPALIDGYQLESQKALVPRILISQKLHEVIQAQISQKPILETPYPLVDTFEDNLPFLNYLNAGLSDAYTADKEAENLRTQIKISGMTDEAFLVSELTHTSRIIGSIRKKMNQRLTERKYTQDVINKYQWQIRYLDTILSKNEKFGF